MPAPKLSPAQVAMAKELSAQGYSLRQVAIHMGVTHSLIYRQCDPKYLAWRDRTRAKLYEDRRSLGPKNVVNPRHIPQHLIDERDKRADLQRQATITASVCGDPLPGYSALDQKQHAQRIPDQRMG